MATSELDLLRQVLYKTHHFLIESQSVKILHDVHMVYEAMKQRDKEWTPSKPHGGMAGSKCLGVVNFWTTEKGPPHAGPKMTINQLKLQ